MAPSTFHSGPFELARCANFIRFECFIFEVKACLNFCSIYGLKHISDVVMETVKFEDLASSGIVVECRRGKNHRQ